MFVFMDVYTIENIKPLLPFAVCWFACAIAATYAAIRRGAQLLKWIGLGVLGGPITLLIALRIGKICPHCRQKIHLKYRVCPHCHLPQTYKYLSNDFRPHPEGLIASDEAANG